MDSNGSNGSNGSNDISGGFHGDVRPVMVPLPWMRVTPTTFSETPNLLRTCQSVESNQPIQPSDDFGTLPCLNLWSSVVQGLQRYVVFKG